MNQIWTIQYLNEFIEPYYGKKNSKSFRHQTSEEWDSDSLEQALEVIRDILDVPLSNLSIEQIRKDFESPGLPLPEEKLVAIQNYYNGRLALWNTIKNDIEKVNTHTSIELKYNIPAKYNSFTVYSDDEENIVQNCAFIKISVKCENNEK